MTYLQGKCSHRRVEEEEEIQRRSNACCQYTPCLASVVFPQHGACQIVLVTS